MKQNLLFRISAFAIIFVLYGSLSAQQIPLTGHYNQAGYLINPAKVVDVDHMKFFTNFRQQWVGIEGAPVSALAAFQANYKGNGFGLMIYSDQVHIINDFTAKFTYGKKIYFSKEKKHNLSFGLSMGFINQGLLLRDANGDFSDPVLNTSRDNSFAFDADFGVSYNLRDFNFGFSIPQLLGNQLIYDINGLEDEYEYGLNRHYLVHASYDIRITEKSFGENSNTVNSPAYIIRPGILYRTVEDGSEQTEFGITVFTKKKHWIGAIYRPSVKTVALQAGIQFLNNFSCGYSYDIVSDGIGYQARGTHEFYLAWNIAKRKDQRPSKVVHFEGGGKSYDKEIDTLNAEISELKELLAAQNEMASKAELDSLKNELNELKNKDQDSPSIVVSSDRSVVDSLKNELSNLRAYMTEFVNENIVKLDPKDGFTSEEDAPPGNYVIIHSFRELVNAKKVVSERKTLGLKTNILYNKDRKWYYVYTHYFKELDPALKVMLETRKNTMHKKSWVHIYRKK